MGSCKNGTTIIFLCNFFLHTYTPPYLRDFLRQELGDLLVFGKIPVTR
jgi:hypothetical protein